MRLLLDTHVLLALIEGWVQTVVSEALGDRIPGTAALSEMLA